MKSKNILIVSCVFPPEPVVSATISNDLANELSSNYKVTVISPKSTRPAGYNFEKNTPSNDKSFKHVVTNSFTSPKSKIITRFYESYSLGKHVVSYIKKNSKSIDVVYINSWPLSSQYLIVKVCKKLKINTVLHIQDIYPETLINKLPALKSFFYKTLLPIDKFILQNAKTVVTISSGMKEHLIETRLLQKENIKIIYNWQNIEKAVSKVKDDALFTFVYLGSLSPSAQIESIIESYGELALAHTKLIIAGSGSEKEFLTNIASNYPTANIQFIKAPSHKVSEIQGQADVLVLSLREGVGKIALPSKLVAYMFSKKPVLAIVERECDVEKIILDAECGWVAEQNQKKSIKETMLKIIGLDKNELLLKGQNSENFAKQNFSKEVNLKKLVHLVTDNL